MSGIYCFAPQSGWNNQQLTKNCGVLPYIFYKNFGFKAVMVTGQKREFPALDTYVKGLEMDITDAPTVEAHLSYIERHVADIDVFVMHSPYGFYAPLLKRYKELRPDGKAYMELDANSAWMDSLYFADDDFREFFAMCDVVGASCRAMQRTLTAKWNIDVDYVPNGFYNFAATDLSVDFSAKENIILTVGRIGTAQKDNETLLTAFAAAAEKLPAWKLELVGNIDPAFNQFIDKYFAAHPALKDRVIFFGAINDKKELMAHYKRAKIFALTSIFEGGTPNVVAEALFSGDFIVTSAIDAAYDATDDDKCGRVFQIGNVDALAKIFLEVCRNDKLLLAGGRHAVEYARDQFDMNKIVARLNYLLYGGETN